MNKQPSRLDGSPYIHLLLIMRGRLLCLSQFVLQHLNRATDAQQRVSGVGPLGLQIRQHFSTGLKFPFACLETLFYSLSYRSLRLYNYNEESNGMGWHAN